MDEAPVPADAAVMVATAAGAEAPVPELGTTEARANFAGGEIVQFEGEWIDGVALAICCDPIAIHVVSDTRRNGRRNAVIDSPVGAFFVKRNTNHGAAIHEFQIGYALKNICHLENFIVAPLHCIKSTSETSVVYCYFDDSKDCGHVLPSKVSDDQAIAGFKQILQVYNYFDTREGSLFLHGDLHSGQVLMSPDKSFRLIDFGNSYLELGNYKLKPASSSSRGMHDEVSHLFDVFELFFKDEDRRSDFRKIRVLFKKHKMSISQLLVRL